MRKEYGAPTKAVIKGKMIASEMPPVEYMLECVRCDETSSTFLRWNRRPERHFDNEKDYKIWNKKWADKEAGCPNSRNYNRILLTYKGIKYHLKSCRVVYKINNPDVDITDKLIDHKDHDTLNDRAGNLDIASPRKNSLNRKEYKYFYPRVAVSSRVGPPKYYTAVYTRADGVKKRLFASVAYNTAAEAYLACWKFMLTDKEFRDSTLDIMTDKEVDGFFVKAALEELKLPSDGIPLTLR